MSRIPFNLSGNTMNVYLTDWQQVWKMSWKWLIYIWNLVAEIYFTSKFWRKLKWITCVLQFHLLTLQTKIKLLLIGKLTPYLSALDFLTWFFNLIFCLFLTEFLQATQAVKIKFEIDKRSNSKIKFKNKFLELEISKIKCR